MTEYQFVTQLCAAYDVCEEQKTIITNKLKQYDYNQIGKIWDTFLDKYTSSKPVVWGVIYSFANEARIFSNTQSGYMWNVCRCGQAYHYETKRCPKCDDYKIDHVSIGTVLPDGFIDKINIDEEEIPLYDEALKEICKGALK